MCLLLLVKNFINMKWVSVDFFLCEMFFFYLFFWNIFEKVMLYEGRERVMIIGENYVYWEYNMNWKDYKVLEEDLILNYI